MTMEVVISQPNQDPETTTFSGGSKTFEFGQTSVIVTDHFWKHGVTVGRTSMGGAVLIKAHLTGIPLEQGESMSWQNSLNNGIRVTRID